MSPRVLVFCQHGGGGINKKSVQLLGWLVVGDGGGGKGAY